MAMTIAPSFVGSAQASRSWVVESSDYTIEENNHALPSYPRPLLWGMNEDEISGKGKQIKGKVREDIGKISGNKEQQVEGKVEQVAGKAKEAQGKAEERAKKESW
jgi:uncharacterized protein YjbJ (UPF0337 family)